MYRHVAVNRTGHPAITADWSRPGHSLWNVLRECWREYLGSYNRGWKEKAFETKMVVDESELDSPTHKVDCYKNRIALEVEWNNKDPFYDRDLNNFRLLFELRAISVGILITRSDELQDIFNEIGRGPSFGASTTHMSKLLPRIDGGGGGGCPILAIGIRRSLYVED